MNFSNENIDLDELRKRAFNLRWATLPKGVIPLTAADPDFPCAPAIIEAVCDYTRAGYFNYGPAEGLESFREAIADFYDERRRVAVDPDLVLPVNSAAQGIYLICKSLLAPGDEAIIFDPVDFLFRHAIEAAGARAVSFAIEPGAKAIDFADLQEVISPRTKLICLCNPLNPTGKVFTAKELRSLAQMAERYGIMVLSDEIWSDIIFGPHGYTSYAALDETVRRHTIIVQGYSKSYGLAGLRVGAIIAPDAGIFRQIFECSMHHTTVNGVSTLSQVAATAALSSGQAWLDEFVRHLARMRSLIGAWVDESETVEWVAPEGCYVAWLNIKKTGLGSDRIYEKLVDKAQVAVVPGLPRWFGAGAAGYIRLSFATSEALLSEALGRMRRVLP